MPSPRPSSTKSKGDQPTYEIILYWSEEDGAVIAEVPELPGCMADGATYQEAVSAAEIVIREWIETAQALGREIPKPRGKLMYA
jgi:predicted RNase H-like HicB family nuclease